MKQIEKKKKDGKEHGKEEESRSRKEEAGERKIDEIQERGD